MGKEKDNILGRWRKWVQIEETMREKLGLGLTRGVCLRPTVVLGQHADVAVIVRIIYYSGHPPH